MLTSEVLNSLINSAFTRETTWLEASNEHPLDEFIETFYGMRKRVEETLVGMTNAQVAFASPAHSLWSISESITHLIYSQGYYINKLLDISTSSLPHIIEAARGFGEGAKIGIPVEDLRKRMVFATEQVTTAIEGTRHDHDPKRTEVNEYFGICNYRTWILLLLAHEVDHLKQIVAMRRLSRVESV
ncbi:MAG: DinB family protein [Chloroflexi bacterium]|nr:DinB family protein [Chloroflexota bacterium]